MSELEARYERGQETRRMFGGGAIAAPGAMGDAWELAPDLERLLDEALFGSIWRRDALTATQREIITLSTFVVRGRNPATRGRARRRRGVASTHGRHFRRHRGQRRERRR